MAKSSRAQVFKSIALAAMGVVALYQLAWVGQTGARLAVNKVWVNRHLDAISRSADVAYGLDYLGYIDFLRRQIPPEATVVDTRTSGLPQYDSPNFVRYFLFPRTTVPLTDATCQGDPDLNQCIISLSGPHTYFMYGADFTPSAAISGVLRVLPFKEGLGILAPQTTQVTP